MERKNNNFKKTEYDNAYIAEHYDRVNLTTQKGLKEKIKEHAAERGESVNAFINRAIAETMARDAEAER